MEAVQRRLEEVINYAIPILPLANVHMVNFITCRLWDTYFPDSIKRELEGKDTSDIFDVFWKSGSHLPGHFKNTCRFLAEANHMSVGANDGITLSMTDLRKKMMIWGCSTYNGLKFEQFMSYKKTHEVEVMSYLVANLASVTSSPFVVDIGGGKGYLSSLLSLEYNLKVLGLDSCNIKTSGAARRAKKLQKVWKGTRKKVVSRTSDSKTEEEDEEWLEDLMKINDISGKYKQLTEYVNEDTDITDIVVKAFSDYSSHNIGLIGLHTCGSLASVCLKQFINNPMTMHYLINVGCCYHLMEEENFSLQGMSATSGFPLSNYLRGKKFAIGRNARMLALQAKSRISSLETVPSEALMFRAVLQQIIIDKMGSDKVPKGQVGRIAEKCSGFLEYFHKAVEKLQLSIEITDDEIQDAYEKYKHWEPKLQVFFMLRVSLAPVLENIVLLDRLLFLKEQGIDHSYLVEMFDPVVSPRCYGLVAFRDKSHTLEV